MKRREFIAGLGGAAAWRSWHGRSSLAVCGGLRLYDEAKAGKAQSAGVEALDREGGAC